MRRANYSVIGDATDSLLLRDLGPWDRHPTITNDAEAVVEDMAPRLKGRRLFYYDSDNQITELLIKDGKFAGYGG